MGVQGEAVWTEPPTVRHRGWGGQGEAEHHGDMLLFPLVPAERGSAAVSWQQTCQANVFSRFHPHHDLLSLSQTWTTTARCSVVIRPASNTLEQLLLGTALNGFKLVQLHPTS